MEIKGPKDLDPVISTIKKQREDGFIPLRDPHIVRELKLIVGLAAKNRLPAMYDDRAFVEAGGLMSYGTDLAHLDRRLAVYVDKILKGAKPADLPVEQPMKFELVINLKAAKQIGQDSAQRAGASGSRNPMTEQSKTYSQPCRSIENAK